jgi:hypothetical protein
MFVAVQIADGLMTYAGVRLFGTGAEGNPLLATWMLFVGAVPALLGAKLLACGCATVLHLCGATRSLAGLTTLYVFGAVVPWLHVLTSVATM